MTKLLERAFEALGRMPPETQDDIARALLGLAEAGEPEDIEPEHEAAVAEGLAQARRGEFVSEEAVDAAFRRFGR